MVNRKKAIDETFVNRIFSRCSFENRYITYGLENGSAAVQPYILKKDGQVEVFHCGLCVNPGLSVLGATPDRGVMECRSGNYGLL